MNCIVIKEGQNSLQCNCHNCKYGIKRSKYNLDRYGAWAYSYNCYLDDYDADAFKCYQAVHVCKNWRMKKNAGNETT